MFLCLRDQKFIDFFLQKRVMPICFSYINKFTICFCIRKKLRCRKPVIYNTVCFLNQFKSFYGNKSGISRTCSNQIYFTCHIIPPIIIFYSMYSCLPGSESGRFPVDLPAYQRSVPPWKIQKKLKSYRSVPPHQIPVRYC